MEQDLSAGVNALCVAHLLREQGVGSSNLPAPTNLFSYLENLLEHRVAVWVAFSRPGSTFLVLPRRALSWFLTHGSAVPRSDQ